MNKRKAQRIHAMRRGLERIGVLPNISALVRQIQTGQAQFVRRQSNRVTHWRMEIAGKPVIAVYDKRRKMIVTFLPVGT